MLIDARLVEHWQAAKPELLEELGRLLGPLAISRVCAGRSVDGESRGSRSSNDVPTEV